MTALKEVGGPDASIILYGRERSSGTYEFFKEHVLSKEDFSNVMQALPGTAAVVHAVKKDPNGIDGLGGVGYAEGLKEAAIKVGEEAILLCSTECRVCHRLSCLEPPSSVSTYPYPLTSEILKRNKKGRR